MSTVNSFDKNLHFAELNSPLFNGNPVPMTPAARKAAAVTNLGFTATAANISAAGNAAASVVSVPDAATYTVLAADTGKIHILPNFTANCTITLPTAAAGLRYEFVAKAVAADAQNWIFAAGVAYLGGVQFADTDEPASPALLTSVFPNGTTNDNMTVVTPSAGTYVLFVCDGTNWIVNGAVYSATVPTFAD